MTTRRRHSPTSLTHWPAILALATAACAVAQTDPIQLTTWTTYTKADGLAGNAIRDILVTEDAVWVGGEGGLSVRRGETWKQWTKKDGLPARTITAIDIDPLTRDVWLGTWEYGLVRFSAGRFDRFDQINAGLAGNLIFDVAVFQNRVWAATNAGVSVFDPAKNNWDVHFARRTDTTQIAVTQFARDKVDLLAGAWGAGIHQYDAQANRWSPLSLTSSLLPIGIDTTITLANGPRSLWWLTATGVLKRDLDGNWSRRSLHQTAEPPWIPTNAAADADDRIWIATPAGLTHCADWNTDTWITYRRRENDRGGTVEITRAGQRLDRRLVSSSIPDSRIRCIAPTDNGVWVGTESGLAFGTTPEKLNLPTHRPTADQAHPNADCTKSPMRSAPVLLKSDDETPTSSAIAFLGPTSRTIAIAGKQPTSIGRADLMAVQIAVEQANKQSAHGGGSPLELIVQTPGYAAYGWGTPEDEFAGFAFQPSIAGLVGYFEPKDKIAAAVTFHTSIPILNAAPITGAFDDDRNIDNPWIFQCWRGQPRQHRLLLNYFFDQLGLSRIAILKTPGRAAQRRINWWHTHAQRRGKSFVVDAPWPTRQQDLTLLLDQLIRKKPEVVLTWCNADTAVDILHQLRSAGLNSILVGGPQLVTDGFLQRAGPDPGPVMAIHGVTPRAPKAQTGDNDQQPLSPFEHEYAERNTRGRVKTPPDANAHRTFETTDHLLQAVGIAGSHRENVRRTLLTMHQSASGERHYERRHSSPGLWLAQLKDGAWNWSMIDVRE